MRTLSALLRLGRPPIARVALSAVLGALTVLAGVGLMGIAGYLIVRAAEHPPVLSLTIAVVAVRACGIGKPIARYLERLESHDLALRVLSRMRVAFYRRLEPLVPGGMRGYRQGDLLARMVGDVDAMQNLYLRGISPSLVALVTGIVSVAIVAVFLPSGALILALGLLLGGIAVPAVASIAGRATGRRRAETRAELSAELVEILRGAPELVVMGADEDTLAKVGELDAKLGRLGRRDAVMGGLVEGLGTLVAGLTVVGVLAASVSATGDGGLDRVLIAALALTAWATFEAVAPLAPSALGLQETLESGRRLLSIAGREPPVADPIRPDAPPTAGTPALEGVAFDHADGETWGLRDVDLRLGPGRRIALVGHSGAGKSTVGALLVRFMDPDAGRVTLGGTDVRSLRQRDVRSRVSLDGQDAHLFSTSIRENVRLARPDASDADMERALRRARIWEWAHSLPDGLDTFVGEEGMLVSGGERRRIALARSFLAGAPVMVLDEPTAHLDPSNARALIAEVLAASEGQSLLLITHAVDVLDGVDEIVQLSRGRVAHGRHLHVPSARPEEPDA